MKIKSSHAMYSSTGSSAQTSFIELSFYFISRATFLFLDAELDARCESVGTATTCITSLKTGTTVFSISGIHGAAGWAGRKSRREMGTQTAATA